MSNAMTNLPQEGMIGKYQIIASLASGSQGTVYRAYDPALQREAAVKVLHPHLASPDVIERFRREAQIVASISHPNIAGISEIGEHNGSHYIAIEYVPHSVGELIRSGQVDVAHAVSIAHQAALALEAARTSRHGITHHDVKPDNLLLTSLDADGAVKLIDFGIAHAEGMASMTQAGSKWGTPFYMPPEQWAGERGDTRSDVYSLGVVMYQMLSGRVPFDSDAENALAQQKAIADQHLEAAPAPLSSVRDDVPEALEAMIAKCMAKSPVDRYRTPGDLAADLAAAFSLDAPSASLTPSSPPVQISPEPSGAPAPASSAPRPRPYQAPQPLLLDRLPALLDKLPANLRNRVPMLAAGGLGAMLVIFTLIIMASQSDDPPPPRIIVVAPPATPTPTFTPAPTATFSPMWSSRPTRTPAPTVVSAVDFIRAALSGTPSASVPAAAPAPTATPALPTATPAPTATPTPDNPYALADLRVIEADFRWHPPNPSVGDLVEFTATIRNDGSRDAGASRLAYSIDSEGGADSGEVAIRPLPAGHSAEATFSWRAEAGFHAVSLEADAGNQVRELSESNNAPAMPLIYHGTALPDLVVESIEWNPRNPELGQPVYFAATVRNAGEGRAEASTLRFGVGENYAREANLPRIPPGETEIAAFEWTAEAGIQSLNAVANAAQTVAETNDENNALYHTYDATVFVDLFVEDITWTPEKPSVGDTVTFAVKVVNGGNLAAGETQVLLLSMPNDLEATLPGVPAGGSTVVEFEWTAAPENVELFAVAENYGNPDAEIDHDNNAIEKTYAATVLPDLVVTNIVWQPETPELGDEVIVAATVVNRGEGRAAAPSVAYSVEAGSFMTKGGRLQIPDLNPGESADATFVWNAGKGGHTFRTNVNSPRTLVETNYDNNETTADYDHTRLANLVVESATWTPEKPDAGDLVTFSAVVRNAGDADAPGFRAGFRDANVGGLLADFQFRGGLAARASANATFQWRAEAGEREFVITADSSNDVDESNEDDNSHSFDYNDTLTADLYIQDIEWNPQTPALGQNVTITVILANRGESAAGESAVEFVIDGPHRASRDLHMPALAPGETAAQSFNWTARLGRFTFTARADAYRQVVETNENNNTLVNNYNDTAQADLVAVNIEVRTANGEYQVRALVENIGGADAGASIAALYVNGQFRADARISRLNAGERDRVYFDDVDLPVGGATLKVVVDSANAVAEAREDNNAVQVVWQ